MPYMKVYAKDSKGELNQLPFSLEEIEDAAVLPILHEYQEKAEKAGKKWPEGGNEIDLPCQKRLTLEECIALRLMFRGKKSEKRYLYLDKELYDEALVDQLFTLMKELWDVRGGGEDWFSGAR